MTLFQVIEDFALLGKTTRSYIYLTTNKLNFYTHYRIKSSLITGKLRI